jgi:hypothetical protein
MQVDLSNPPRNWFLREIPGARPSQNAARKFTRASIALHCLDQAAIQTFLAAGPVPLHVLYREFITVTQVRGGNQAGRWI